jgi:acetyl esterase/lipase
MKHSLLIGVLIIRLLGSALALADEKPLVVDVWPGGKAAEDDAARIGPDRVRDDVLVDGKPYERAGRPVKWITAVTHPTITLYRPAAEKNNGAAVLVCPGGGYWNLAIDLEGEEVAKWLTTQGVTGIVLKYRVPRRPGMPEREPNPGALKDAQRAVSLVRSRAREWGIDPTRIGMAGFSAGGHLVAATATNFHKRSYARIDAIDEASCRPDFGIVCYPGYIKSAENDELAPTLRATADAPPLFIVHTSDDSVSPSDHSVLLYSTLKRAGASVELHIYETGEHGFGVRQTAHPVTNWTEKCASWMRRHGLLEPRSQAAPSGPHDDLKLFFNLRYREGSHKNCVLDLAMPRTPSAKPRPAIVVIHGGGWIEGDKSSFSSYEHRVPGNVFDFARAGFVAVTINYRLAKEFPYPAGLHDCQCAIRWLRAHASEYNIDQERIGAYGNSAGGHLSLLLAMIGNPEELEADTPWKEYSSRVQAVASDSGPLDLVHQYEQGTLRSAVSSFMNGAPEGGRLAQYIRASPIHHVGKATPPLLLIYGVDDNQVPVETADQFVSALQKAGLKDVSYQRLAAMGHCPHSLLRVPWLQPVVMDFFGRTLKN